MVCTMPLVNEHMEWTLFRINHIALPLCIEEQVTRSENLYFVADYSLDWKNRSKRSISSVCRSS